MASVHHGVVYTKKWVVNLILDVPARHRLQQGIPIREHVRGSRLESTWIRLQLSFVTISLMRVSILMRSMTKDACAHITGLVPSHQELGLAGA